MKGTEQLLDHAFALARRARDPVPSEPPFGMETAVLAQWRSSRGSKLDIGMLAVFRWAAILAQWKSSCASSKIDIGMLRVFRWAAIVACVVAVAGGAWKYEEIAQISQRLDPETRIVDSALLAGLDG